MEEIVVRATRPKTGDETFSNAGMSFSSGGGREVFPKEYLEPMDITELTEIDVDTESLNQPVRYDGQARDEIMKAIRDFATESGKNLYDAAATTSRGIANIPIAGIAYQNAVAGANPGMFLAGKQLAPKVMSDFGFAEGGRVDAMEPLPGAEPIDPSSRLRSAERRPYFRVPDRETGEYDDIRLGRLRNVFTRLLRDPTDEDSIGTKLGLLAAEVGLSPFKVADMFLEFSTGATPIDSYNLYMDRPERVFRDSPAVRKYAPYNVEKKDYTEEFSPEEFRQYRPNDRGPRPSFIPGFEAGGEAKSFPDLNNDGEVTYADILKGRGVEMNEGGSVRDPYYNPYFGRANPDEVERIMKQNPGISLQDAISIALGIDTADKTTRQGYAHGGPVRRRVPDVYFDQYNMGGPVSKTPVPNINPMMQDPRFYNPPPNPMGPLVGGIGNLVKNQQKTNKLLGGSNQNNDGMNNNLKIAYAPTPTSKEQRLVFSNVLESTRPVV